MYEDSSWYSFVPDLTGKKATATKPTHTHRRKESLLQQPNGADTPVRQPLTISEIQEETSRLPDAELITRAASFTDLRSLSNDYSAPKGKTRKKSGQGRWEALDLPEGQRADELSISPLLDKSTDPLLRESRRDYTLYREKLALSERHLDSLIEDANTSLALLNTLSTSFKSVEAQTSSFQSRCDHLLKDQSRLQRLADEVGTNLYYYAYLDNVSRRLNAPGAAKLAEHDDLSEVLDNLEACIEFMTKHPAYRDAESYLARYQSLLTKALHILEVGFSNRLEAVSQNIARQLATTQSESARHALAYGRFEETLLESYALIPNVQRVVLRAYDRDGASRHHAGATAVDIYTNTANNMFHAFLTTRDRDLRSMIQAETEEFRKEAGGGQAVETACRGYAKQCFERAYNEGNLLTKIFGVSPLPSAEPGSAFAALQVGQRWLATPANLRPLAANLQAVLQGAEMQSLCTFVGWLAHEYLEYEYAPEDESPFVSQCRQYAVSLLSGHLWAFTDAAFEAEIGRSITRGEVGVGSYDVHPVLKRAVELLVMFDQCMPKERSQQDSPVVFKIVRETINVLQRAEAKIKSSRGGDVDPDLFMIKNLLLLKNELVSLEIGDIRSSGPASSMQHFSRVWETMSPQNWVGFFGSLVASGTGSSLWSLGGSGTASATTKPSVTAKTLTVEDMSEQLDELLRQSIYAFTKRCAARLNSARAGGKGVRGVEEELVGRLRGVFGERSEVVGKLMEAIRMNAQALEDAEGQKTGARRY